MVLKAKFEGLGQTPPPDQGFSTIEVVVALVILSVALIPLIDVQLNIIRTSKSLEARSQLTTAEEQALTYIKMVNVGSNPEGFYDFGDSQVTWRATLIDEDAAFNQILPDRIRRIGLYEVSVTASSGLNNRSEKSVRLVGWKDQIYSE